MFNKTNIEETRILKNRAALIEGENSRLREKIEKLETKLTCEQTMVNYYKSMSQVNLDVRIQLEAQIAKMTEEVAKVSEDQIDEDLHEETEDVSEVQNEVSGCDESREAAERLGSGAILPQIRLSPDVALRPPTE